MHYNSHIFYGSSQQQMLLYVCNVLALCPRKAMCPLYISSVAVRSITIQMTINTPLMVSKNGTILVKPGN
jgi:hypothetical protein